MVWGTYFFLHYHTDKQTALWKRMTQWSRKTHLGHTAWWLRFQAFLDSPEVKDSDDEGHEKACGICGTCIDRKKAFEENGAVDPIAYENE